MNYMWLTCNDCNEENEIVCNGDSPLFCPDCRSVDNFSDIEENSIDNLTLITRGENNEQIKKETRR